MGCCCCAGQVVAGRLSEDVFWAWRTNGAKLDWDMALQHRNYDNTPSFNSNYRHLQWFILFYCILLGIIHPGTWDFNMLGLELNHR